LFAVTKGCLSFFFFYRAANGEKGWARMSDVGAKHANVAERSDRKTSLTVLTACCRKGKAQPNVFTRIHVNEMLCMCNVMCGYLCIVFICLWRKEDRRLQSALLIQSFTQPRYTLTRTRKTLVFQATRIVRRNITEPYLSHSLG